MPFDCLAWSSDYKDARWQVSSCADLVRSDGRGCSSVPWRKWSTRTTWKWLQHYRYGNFLTMDINQWNMEPTRNRNIRVQKCIQRQPVKYRLYIPWWASVTDMNISLHQFTQSMNLQSLLTRETFPLLQVKRNISGHGGVKRTHFTQKCDLGILWQSTWPPQQRQLGACRFTSSNANLIQSSSGISPQQT